MSILNLPQEILGFIFQYVCTPSFYPIPFEPTPGHKNLRPCLFVHSSWSKIAIQLYRRDYLHSRVLSFIALPGLLNARLHQTKDWTVVCMVVLACLYQREWSLGAPRLFHVTDPSVYESLVKHPNPHSPLWKKLLECSTDLFDSFWELAAQLPLENDVLFQQPFDADTLKSITKSNTSLGTMAPSQDNIPIMLRYSERMDIGVYLVFIKLSFGAVLLRCKPIGEQQEEIGDFCGMYNGSGRVVLWDAHAYGICLSCQTRLVRIQACAVCRVAQYCSRHCQRLHWEKEHKFICKSLGFYPIIPSDED